MKLLKTVLAHGTLVFSVTLLVPLFIDLFFNDAMNFINNTLYKTLLFIGLLLAASYAALKIYYKKKK